MADFAWTHGGYNMFFRSLLYFKLDSIPKGSTVQSAILYLYSDPTMTDPNSNNSNSQLSGSNAFYLEKAMQEWDENTVTWNNQPATTTAGRIWVGPSTSTTENIQVNLTTIVQGWVNSPVTNSGLKMTLENEVKYRARNYASSDHTNTAIRPKVVITYAPPANLVRTCATPDITEQELKRCGGMAIQPTWIAFTTA
jgi:hypothetical protein